MSINDGFHALLGVSAHEPTPLPIETGFNTLLGVPPPRARATGFDVLLAAASAPDAEDVALARQEKRPADEPPALERPAKRPRLSVSETTLPTKVEAYEAALVDWLARNLSSDCYDVENVRTRLEALRNAVTVGNGATNVVYDYAKPLRKLRFGRMYPRGTGAALGLARNERNFLLASAGLEELDMVNAHYVLARHEAQRLGLVHDCIARYVGNRDACLAEVMEGAGVSRCVAKRLFLKMAFGGGPTVEDDVLDEEGNTRVLAFDSPLIAGLKQELSRLASAVWDDDEKAQAAALATREHKSRRKVAKSADVTASALAHHFQDLERQCLLAVDAVLPLVVLIHDGAAVPAPRDEEERAQMIRTAEQAVEAATGVVIRFDFKAPETCYSLEEARAAVARGPYRVAQGAVDDLVAARCFVRLMNGGGLRVLLDGETVWCYDERTGMWGANESHVAACVVAVGEDSQLHWIEVLPRSVNHRNYAGTTALRKRLVANLVHAAPRHDGWMEEHERSDRFRLLFSDGILDMATGVFSPGFDPGIVFVARVPRPWAAEPLKPRNAGVERRITQALFEDPYGGAGTGDAALMRHFMMRSLAGDTQMKQAVLLIGPPNSCKSLCGKLMTTAFGGYYGSFDMDNLLLSRGGGEPARASAWVDFNARMLFASEASAGRKGEPPLLNSKLFKSLTSGGTDRIQRRTLYTDLAQEHAVRALFLLASNGMPAFDVNDAAVAERVRQVTQTISFVAHPRQTHERQADPELGALFATPEYGDGLLHLLVDECVAWCTAGRPVLERTAAEIEAVEDTGGESIEQRIQDAVLGEFEVTNNEDDRVSNQEFAACIDGLGGYVSPGTVRVVLNRLCGCPRARTGTVRFRTGWRRRTDADAGPSQGFFGSRLGQ